MCSLRCKGRRHAACDVLSVAVGAGGCAQPIASRPSAINNHSQISTSAAKTVTSDCAPFRSGSQTHFDSSTINHQKVDIAASCKSLFETSLFPDGQTGRADRDTRCMYREVPT